MILDLDKALRLTLCVYINLYSIPHRQKHQGLSFLS